MHCGLHCEISQCTHPDADGNSRGTPTPPPCSTKTQFCVLLKSPAAHTAHTAHTVLHLDALRLDVIR